MAPASLMLHATAPGPDSCKDHAVLPSKPPVPPPTSKDPQQKPVYGWRGFFHKRHSSSAGGAPPASVAHQPHDTTVQELEVTAEQVKFVRDALSEDVNNCCDDATVTRFIRATGANLQLSIKRLEKTAQWRQQTKPESVVCKACVRDCRSHYMHLIGYDKQDRPIIYSCLARAGNKVFDDNRDHMIQTFEMAIKCMPAGVSQWIWVCDFHGFGMADVNPKLAKLFLEISAEHYPERLGLFIIVDAPALFGALWGAIQSFVDPKTQQKIKFLPYDNDAKHLAKHPSKLAEEMAVHFDTMTNTWLLREMADNRDKRVLAATSYDMCDICKAAKAGELVSSGFGDAPGQQHDLRGTAQLLEVYAKDPAVMEPQGAARLSQCGK